MEILDTLQNVLNILPKKTIDCLIKKRMTVPITNVSSGNFAIKSIKTKIDKEGSTIFISLYIKLIGQTIEDVNFTIDQEIQIPTHIIVERDCTFLDTEANTEVAIDTLKIESLMLVRLIYTIFACLKEIKRAVADNLIVNEYYDMFSYFDNDGFKH